MRAIQSWLCLYIIVIFLSSLGTVQAQDRGPDLVVHVRGMVCSFCVQGVEKKLLSVKGVRQVAVTLKAKSVKLWLHDGASVSDADLKSAIEAAGYNLKNVVRRAEKLKAPPSPATHAQPPEHEPAP